MGYACPVCGDPQSDGEHLANHLAFTAMLGDEDHESWLDEHAPDWASADADSLAATVTDHAESAEFPQVFEDTTDEPDHAHDQQRSGALFDDEGDGVEGVDADAARRRASRDRDLDAEAEGILREAREMTREMRTTDGTDGTGGEGSDQSASPGADPDESETE